MDPYTNQLNQISLFYNDRAQNSGLVPELINSTNYALSPYINTKIFYQTQIAGLSKSLQLIQEKSTNQHLDIYSLQEFLEINLPILTGYTFDIAELLDDAFSFSKQDPIIEQTFPVRTENSTTLSKQTTSTKPFQILASANKFRTDSHNLSGKMEHLLHVKEADVLTK